MSTLLIVDDHEGFRSFVKTLLDGDGFVVSGVAEDGESALEAVGRLRPDLVLLDINLPDIDGFEVAERLAAAPHRPDVVLISTRVAADYGPRLERSPVLGFVTKLELSASAIRRLREARSS